MEKLWSSVYNTECLLTASSWTWTRRWALHHNADWWQDYLYCMFQLHSLGGATPQCASQMTDRTMDGHTNWNPALLSELVNYHIYQPFGHPAEHYTAPSLTRCMLSCCLVTEFMTPHRLVGGTVNEKCQFSAPAPQPKNSKFLAPRSYPEISSQSWSPFWSYKRRYMHTDRQTHQKDNYNRCYNIALHMLQIKLVKKLR